MTLIAEAGATHVAVATPYDTKFLPVLELWVASARAHGLKVWFRGNFSGWEGWFSFAKIDRAAHKKLLQSFVHNNPNLFESGDVFTPCPECENGGPGDPRQSGDVKGYNTFLIDEEKVASAAFGEQGKTIAVYPSMNGDIAREILSPAVVRAFGGTILIDHYVSTVKQFRGDLKAISEHLGATVGLGEVGAPIPDLQGKMTEAKQAAYIDALFEAMSLSQERVPVVNYWTLSGGSTALVHDNGEPRAAYTTVQNYFKAFNVYGTVYDSLGEVIHGAKLSVAESEYTTVSGKTFQLFAPRHYTEITVEAEGYKPATFTLPEDKTTTLIKHDFYLTPTNPDWWYKFRTYHRSITNTIIK